MYVLVAGEKYTVDKIIKEIDTAIVEIKDEAEIIAKRELLKYINK